MITSNGKIVIARNLAGLVPQIAGSLVLGAGTTAATVNDVRLQYETLRTSVVSINSDLLNSRLIIKGTIQPGTIGTIYEIGAYSTDRVAEDYVTLPLLGVLPQTWTNGTLTSANARAYTQALKIDFSASGTTNAEITGFSTDLSSFTDLDYVVVGFYATTNLSSAKLRLGADSSNYYEFSLTAPVVGYNVYRLNRSAAAKTGSPSWAAITYAAVRPSGTAAGSGSLYFDGARFEANSINTSNLLIARTVLATPIVVDPDVVTDVEYSLGINIS